MKNIEEIPFLTETNVALKLTIVNFNATRAMRDAKQSAKQKSTDLSKLQFEGTASTGFVGGECAFCHQVLEVSCGGCLTGASDFHVFGRSHTALEACGASSKHARNHLELAFIQHVFESIVKARPIRPLPSSKG
jgi:hypothetical protein